jgi:hypothetical protein
VKKRKKREIEEQIVSIIVERKILGKKTVMHCFYIVNDGVTHIFLVRRDLSKQSFKILKEAIGIVVKCNSKLPTPNFVFIEFSCVMRGVGDRGS